MRALIPLSIAARTVVERCMASLSDKDLTARLELAADAITASEHAYAQHGNAACLHLVPSTKDVAGHVTTEEMTRVYDSTFVPSARTRDIYAAIKKLPENDMCPRCGQRTVSTLDHFLPKANYPALAVTPLNLVPACFECNFAKRDATLEEASDVLIHPYFDRVDDERWLYSTVLETSPAALSFYPNPPDSWDAVLQQRIREHFRTLRLGALYASHAGVELNDIRAALEGMSRKNGPTEIQQHLRERERSCAIHQPNSWKRAMYDGLAASSWFCNGGFTASQVLCAKAANA